MRKFLSILFLLVIGINLFAQWEGNYLPRYRHIYGSKILDVNTIVLVGGHPSNDAITTIYKTTDRGNSWEILSDKPDSPMLRDLAFPSFNIGYAVGWNGKIIKTSDSGDTWTDKPASGSAASRSYNSCFFINNNIGYAVGGNQTEDSIQTIIKTTDGANTWNIQRDVFGNWLNSVFFVNDNLGFAVGDKGVVLKTENSGNTWTEISLNGVLADRNYNDVYFKDSNHGWLVGGNKTMDSICTVLYTSDGGNNWNIIIDIIQNQANKIVFSEPNVAWIALDDGKILKSNDAGQSFYEINTHTSLTDEMDLLTIDFSNNGIGVFAGEYGKVLIYQDNPVEIPLVETLSAIIEPPTNAILHGKANPMGGETSLSFEYGNTPNLGSVISANPSLANSNTFVNFEAELNVSEPGMFYYRAKAENIGGIAYGEIKQVYIGPNPIPNFDFEEWNTYSRDIPLNATIMGDTRKVNSYDGSYAIELYSGGIVSQSYSDHSISVFGFGNDIIFEDDMGHQGWVPFSERPDSLYVYLNYNLEPGTKAMVVLILSKNITNNIASQIIELTGSTDGVFTLHAFKIDYLNQETPDTLLLGFINNSLYDEDLQGLSNSLMIDNISFSGTNQNVPNADLELWEDPQYVEIPVSWLKGASDCFYKSENPHHGQYALKIETNFRDKITHLISTSAETNTPVPFPVFARHAVLNGYYNFNPKQGDFINISVNFFNNANEVGNGYLILTEATNGYEEFSVDINYVDENIIPDSALITINVGGETYPSTAYFDMLSFDGFFEVEADNIEDFDISKQITIYPNPAQEFFAIANNTNQEIKSIELVNMNGQKIDMREVYNSFNNILMFDTSYLKQGIYVVLIKFNDNKVITKKVIIK